jgi:hypothetical protein
MILESHDLVHGKPKLHPMSQAVIGILSQPLLDILAPQLRLTLIATQHVGVSKSAAVRFGVSQEHRLEPAADKVD